MCGLASPAQAQAPSQPAVVATIVPVVAQDVPVVRRGIGTVQAFNTVMVRARVDGTLDAIKFTEGQNVTAGQTLATIDPRPYQAALDQASAKKAQDQAQLANAQLDLQRYANLAKNEFASRQSVDTQRALVLQYSAALQGDDAAIAAAQLNLSFCTILSPIDGVAGLKMVDVGNLIHATDAQGLVTVAQVQPISVVFSLPQDDLPAVQAAMMKAKLAAVARNSDDSATLAEGTLLTPDNTIDSSTGAIKLKATFANENRALWPGQFVNVQVVIGTLPQAATVPSTAVVHGPDGLYVYLVKPDQTVTRQAVTVGPENAGVTVIVKGVAAGQNVVSAGQSRLQEGSRVTADQPQTHS
jgi:multidrug efflux system membrane fusion protein